MFTVLRVVANVVVLALGLWLSYRAVSALLTGTANVHGDLVRRRQRPTYYWVAVIAQTIFAALCIVVAFRRLVGTALGFP